MGSSITGRCNDARSEEMNLLLWFKFDSYYDFGELLSILIVLISLPWNENIHKHNFIIYGRKFEFFLKAGWPAPRFWVHNIWVTHVCCPSCACPWTGEKSTSSQKGRKGAQASPHHPQVLILCLLHAWVGPHSDLRPSFGLVSVLAVIPVYLVSLSVCLECVCYTSYPCPALWFWILPLTLFHRLKCTCHRKCASGTPVLVATRCS